MAIITIDEETLDRLRRYSDRQHGAGTSISGNTCHWTKGDSRELHQMGTVGEWLVCQYLDVEFDYTDKPRGDRGHDIRVGDCTIDVKTTSKTDQILRVKAGKVKAKIYVSVYWERPGGDGWPRPEQCWIIGWERAEVVIKQPKQGSPYGHKNHCLSPLQLRPMIELKRGLEKIRAQQNTGKIAIK